MGMKERRGEGGVEIDEEVRRGLRDSREDDENGADRKRRGKGWRMR